MTGDSSDQAGGAARRGEGSCDEILSLFGLPAEWVIHTVAPRWHDGTDGELLLLGWCYIHALAAADEVDAESVAFPALGAGARCAGAVAPTEFEALEA